MYIYTYIHIYIYSYIHTHTRQSDIFTELQWGSSPRSQGPVLLWRGGLVTQCDIAGVEGCGRVEGKHIG